MTSQEKNIRLQVLNELHETIKEKYENRKTPKNVITNQYDKGFLEGVWFGVDEILKAKRDLLKEEI